MLTPLDIENREFKRTFTGYKRDDVEDFMSLILHDYERMYKENLAFKDKVELLTNAVNHYKVQEETMKNSIVVAQKAADMLTHSSTENAELIIKEAKIQAENIIRDAQDTVVKIKERHTRLLQEVESYRLRSTAIIKAQLDILQDISAENNIQFDIMQNAAESNASIIANYEAMSKKDTIARSIAVDKYEAVADDMSFNTENGEEDVEDGNRTEELQSNDKVTAD